MNTYINSLLKIIFEEILNQSFTNQIITKNII